MDHNTRLVRHMAAVFHRSAGRQVFIPVPLSRILRVMNRAIFLDRDNTLIHNDSDLGDPALVKLIQGAASAVASLRGLGYKIVVVTNQGGVARGKYGEAEVEKVNNQVNDLIKASTGAMIDRFYYCPFHPEGTVEKYCREHPWRKPQPGMILQAIKDLDLDGRQCWMIGDQMRDIQAGAAAQVRTILLRPDAGEQPPLLQSNAAAHLYSHGAGPIEVMPDFVARNLIEAVRIVAQQRRPEGLDDARLAGTTATTAAPHVRQTPPPVRAAASGSAGISLGRPAMAAPAAPVAPPVEAPPQHPTSMIGLRPTTGFVAGPSAGSAGGTSTSPSSTIAEIPARHADVIAAPVIKVEPTAAPAPASPPAERLPDAGSVELSLRQILQELRNQRPATDQVSYVAVLAIVTQMVAVLCLLGALWLGRGDGRGEVSSFFHWLGVGLFVQLATIALLLFHRK